MLKISLRPCVFAMPAAALWLGIFPVLAESAEAPAALAGSPDDWLPSSAMFVFHSGKPDAVLDLIFDPAVAGQVPLGEGPAAMLSGIARYLETQLGCDWKTALRRTMRHGFTLAVGPGGGVVLIAQAEDETFLQKMNEAFVQMGRWGKPENVSQTEYAGSTCWTFSGGKMYHAIVGGRLILSNRLPGLQMVLDLRAGAIPSSESLAGLAGYQEGRRAARADASAVMLAAPGLVNALPPFQRKPDASPNPAAVLLLGRSSQSEEAPSEAWPAFELDVKGRALSARLSGERLAGQAVPFAAPPVGDGVLPNPAVPRQIAALSLWRDLRAFYAGKDALFPERTSGLILFENMMGIYFSGRDLTEDVLGALDPHVRLVVAGQDYDPQTGTPAVKWPALAAVFRMREPDRFGPVMEEAWQKALGLVNFTRGQKAEAGLILDKRDHGGVRYTFAAFSAAEEPDKTKLDVRFNLQPSLARAGEFLILSSTTQITDDLIDALQRPMEPVAASNGLLEIDGTRLASILLENREGIVRGNMLKKGQERAAAEKEFGGVATVARLLGQATLQTGEAASQPFVDLRLEFGSGTGAGR